MCCNKFTIKLHFFLIIVSKLFLVLNYEENKNSLNVYVYVFVCVQYKI